MGKVQDGVASVRSEFWKDNAFKLSCLARLDIHLKGDPAEPHVMLGNLILVRCRMEEALDCQVLPHPDNRIVWTSHPDIRNESGPLWQDSSVCSWRVCMRSNDRADTTVEVPRKCC